VAEGFDAPVLRERGEAAEPAAGYVLEEDTLDGILGAEGQDFVELGLGQDWHAAIVAREGGTEDLDETELCRRTALLAPSGVLSRANSYGY
jgi:hypothetical protein